MSQNITPSSIFQSNNDVMAISPGNSPNIHSKPPQSSLFSNNSMNTNIFPTNQTNTSNIFSINQPKNNAVNSNIFGTNQSQASSIFGNINNTSTQSNQLFGGNTNQTNQSSIFGNTGIQQNGSIFNNNSNTSTNLTSNQINNNSCLLEGWSTNQSKFIIEP